MLSNARRDSTGCAAEKWRALALPCPRPPRTEVGEAGGEGEGDVVVRREHVHRDAEAGEAPRAGLRTPKEWLRLRGAAGALFISSPIHFESDSFRVRFISSPIQFYFYWPRRGC